MTLDPQARSDEASAGSASSTIAIVGTSVAVAAVLLFSGIIVAYIYVKRRRYAGDSRSSDDESLQVKGEAAPPAVTEENRNRPTGDGIPEVANKHGGADGSKGASAPPAAPDATYYNESELGDFGYYDEIPSKPTTSSPQTQTAVDTDKAQTKTAVDTDKAETKTAVGTDKAQTKTVDDTDKAPTKTTVEKDTAQTKTAVDTDKAQTKTVDDTDKAKKKTAVKTDKAQTKTAADTDKAQRKTADDTGEDQTKAVSNLIRLMTKKGADTGQAETKAISKPAAATKNDGTTTVAAGEVSAVGTSAAARAESDANASAESLDGFYTDG